MDVRYFCVMKQLREKPIILFFLLVILLALPLCTLPINLFPGVVEYGAGKSVVKIEAPLSLSYFLGLGYKNEEMIGVSNFYLNARGYLLAICFLIGVPALVVFRLKSKRN
jgi:hypothetical protein